MHAKNLVICDAEQEYSRRLLHRLTEKGGRRMQPYLFHSMEEAEMFAESRRIDVLLISQLFSQEERSRIPAGSRYVLVDGMGGQMSGEEKPVSRYQSAGAILEQIMGEAPVKKADGVQKTEAFSTDNVEGTEWIGVYSPIRRIGRTRFALRMGKRMAQKVPVLYLNLEEYGGSAYFEENPEYTLADLLYYVRQEKESLGLRLSTMTSRMDRLDYLNPIPYSRDLREVRGEEWIRLFERIGRECIYEKVILDLGDSVDGLLDILKFCTTIYTPYIEEPAAMGKLAQYTEDLRHCGMDDILEKTVQKKMTRAGRKGEKERGGGTAL